MKKICLFALVSFTVLAFACCAFAGERRAVRYRYVGPGGQNKAGAQEALQPTSLYGADRYGSVTAGSNTLPGQTLSAPRVTSAKPAVNPSAAALAGALSPASFPGLSGTTPQIGGALQPAGGALQASPVPYRSLSAYSLGGPIPSVHGYALAPSGSASPMSAAATNLSPPQLLAILSLIGSTTGQLRGMGLPMSPAGLGSIKLGGSGESLESALLSMMSSNAAQSGMQSIGAFSPSAVGIGQTPGMFPSNAWGAGPQALTPGGAPAQPGMDFGSGNQLMAGVQGQSGVLGAMPNLTGSVLGGGLILPSDSTVNSLMQIFQTQNKSIFGTSGGGQRLW